MLGHHEQDSTHISYSVITAGVSTGGVQLEASTFHGRNPMRIAGILAPENRTRIRQDCR